MTATFSGTGRSPSGVCACSVSGLLRESRFERRTSECQETQTTIQEVVIDFARIETISSEDLNALIRFHTLLRHEAAALVLINVSQHISEVFQFTRLNRLFTVRELLAPASFE